MSMGCSSDRAAWKGGPGDIVWAAIGDDLPRYQADPDIAGIGVILPTTTTCNIYVADLS